MSIYQVQLCLFQHLRDRESASAGETPDLHLDRYELTDDERRALAERDIGALYAMGTHPVIINGWCRAQGYKRADYRPLFAPGQDRVEGSRRWLTS